MVLAILNLIEIQFWFAVIDSSTELSETFEILVKMRPVFIGTNLTWLESSESSSLIHDNLQAKQNAGLLWKQHLDYKTPRGYE